ncbi:MAG TPA: hypothetical protein VFE76_08675 [Myxococcales bacterium]|nr:hypothetical protein [Myxococcales bacterium]
MLDRIGLRRGGGVDPKPVETGAHVLDVELTVDLGCEPRVRVPQDVLPGEAQGSEHGRNRRDHRSLMRGETPDGSSGPAREEFMALHSHTQNRSYVRELLSCFFNGFSDVRRDNGSGALDSIPAHVVY